MKITAAVVEAAGAEFQFSELELAEPGPGEIRVKIHACGICHTDIGAQQGNYPTGFPAVFGHEGAGVVERTGEGVSKVVPGDYVVLSFNSCGACSHCHTGFPAYCSNAMSLNVSGHRGDGVSAYSRNGDSIKGHFFSQSSFATHSIVYERNLVKVSKDIPLAELAPLGCGIQTGAGAFLNTLPVKAGMRVAVIGTGSVGLSAIMAARLAGCAVIVAIDILESRLQLAAELGATHTIDGRDPKLVEQLIEISSGGLDGILDTTSIPALLRQAVLSLNARGTLLLGGAAKPGSTVEFDMGPIHYGRTVRGTLEGDSIPDEFIPQLIEHYRAGRFPMDKLISYYDFKDLNQAMRDTHAGKAVKAVLKMV